MSRMEEVRTVRIIEWIYRLKRQAEEEDRSVRRILVSERGVAGCPLLQPWQDWEVYSVPEGGVKSYCSDHDREILLHPSDWLRFKKEGRYRLGVHGGSPAARVLDVPVYGEVPERWML